MINFLLRFSLWKLMLRKNGIYKISNARIAVCSVECFDMVRSVIGIHHPKILFWTFRPTWTLLLQKQGHLSTGSPSLIRHNSFSEFGGLTKIGFLWGRVCIVFVSVQSKPICTTQHYITVVKRYWMILQKISACLVWIKFIYQFCPFTEH